MARSTLELLLESIKDKEEDPAEELPWLPKRPPSRARLPSSRVRASLLFAEHNLSGCNGNQLLQASSMVNNFHSKERNGSAVTVRSDHFMSEKDEAQLKKRNNNSVDENHLAIVGSPSDAEKSQSKERNDHTINGNHFEMVGRPEEIDVTKQHGSETVPTDEESVDSIKKQKPSSEELGSIKKRKRDYTLAWRKVLNIPLLMKS